MSRTNRAGFTIVELLIAVVILGMGIIVMARSMVDAGTTQRLGISRVEMTSLAQSKLEELRSLTVSQADTMSLTFGGSLTSNVANHWDQVTSAVGRDYRRRWLVAAGPSGSRDITLRIEPVTQARGEIDSLDFYTLVLMGE